MPAVDVRQFECFIAVAEEKHIGRAAARLHMTQPPLTRRITRLEGEVGALLFVRTAAGVELTAAGEVLLERAYRIVQVTGQAVERTRLAHHGQAGAFVVGYFGSMIFDVVPRLLRAFLDTRPAVDLVLERASTSVQADAIRGGGMHLGFSRRYPDEVGLVVDDIPGESMHVALPLGHPLLDRAEVRVADLAAEGLVLFPTRPRPSFGEEVADLFTDAGVEMRVAREAEDVVTALAYVATAKLCTVVLRSATRIRLPGIGFVPLTGVASRPLSCLHRQESPPVVKAFLDFVGKNDFSR
ncbi:LysR family transcriptional regulator [Umezawaea sp. NPDC059074]|uniref:LysR family transcriptional regulator n=1 Tax=Umezawaea sp. NPDC059074 TaxID=3346716 RepID=UPI00369FC729